MPQDDTRKAENIISMALAAVVLFAVLAIQRRWNPANLTDVASSAEDFILTTTGIRGQVPDLAGYEKLKTFHLGNYRAGLYRVSPAPLLFASGRLVIYNRDDRPVYSQETLEGSKEPWTTLYDFSGRHGLTGNRAHPDNLRDLTGAGVPNIIVGQYSGGDHCCTVATIVALGAETVTRIGRIDGLDGLPFEGLEVRRLTKNRTWECIAHRPYLTACGTHFDAADVISVYSFENGQYRDLSPKFPDYYQEVLRQNLGKWRQERNRNLNLLQTLAGDYTVLGQADEGKRFFAMNLGLLMPVLQKQNLDPNVCQEALEALLNRLTGVPP